jgi:hypothetical protein
MNKNKIVSVLLDIGIYFLMTIVLALYTNSCFNSLKKKESNLKIEAFTKELDLFKDYLKIQSNEASLKVRELSLDIRDFESQDELIDIIQDAQMFILEKENTFTDKLRIPLSLNKTDVLIGMIHNMSSKDLELLKEKLK